MGSYLVAVGLTNSLEINQCLVRPISVDAKEPASSDRICVKYQRESTKCIAYLLIPGFHEGYLAQEIKFDKRPYPLARYASLH